MITITARFNVSENGGTINSINSNILGNNVSANINDILGKRSVAIGNPFILGKSVLDSGAYYTNSLPYFLGSQLSNYKGDFKNSYTITLNGSGITQFVIAFDTENRAFPNSILVDGETFYDDDPIWEINCKTADTHTIEISNWNTPYSPLIITSLYADININVDKDNLMSFNSDIIDRADINFPTYGIISNSASISFSDLDESTLDLITQQILKSNIQVKVYLNNSEAEKPEETEPICVMETRGLSYNIDNRQVQVSLKDNIEEWQEINIEGINYDPLDGNSQTAQWFYEYLYSKTPKEYDMLSFEELDEKIQDKLKNTMIMYPLLESDTLWNSWQKFCELCFLHIYVNYDGRVVVK